MELTDAQRQFLENPFVGVVTTLQPDGMPQSTVVWVDVDDEGVSINTAYGRVKPRNLERDPRLSLVVVDPDDP
jgi:PPOX class probable F420-dependent enzyme